jgi:hypothetical protein
MYTEGENNEVIKRLSGFRHRRRNRNYRQQRRAGCRVWEPSSSEVGKIKVQDWTFRVRWERRRDPGWVRTPF